MLFDRSEEGDVEGLALLAGEVVRFPHAGRTDESGQRLKVPHMGWNEVHQTLRHPLWEAIPDRSRFYFVHSYYPAPADRSIIAGYSLYPFPFACAVARANVFAVQFHPEKSQASGLRLLRNFVRWDGACTARIAESAVPRMGP
jgi:glutamine amidotransferase